MWNTIIGTAIGVIAGYIFIEIRTYVQQKPKQKLIEKHKKNIKQFMLFYMRPREERPAVAKNFEEFLNGLVETNKDIVCNFFRYTKIAESEDDLKILFNPEYFKNNIYAEKFPIVDELFAHYYQLLMAGCFDEEILEVLKGAPRKNINYNPMVDFRPMTKEEIDSLFDENK